MKLEQLKKLLSVLILLHLRKTYAFTFSIRDYQKENSMEEHGVLVQLTKKDLFHIEFNHFISLKSLLFVNKIVFLNHFSDIPWQLLKG